MTQRRKQGEKKAAEYVLLTVLVLAHLAAVFLATVLIAYNVSDTEWPMWLMNVGVVGVVTLTALLGLLWMSRGEQWMVTFKGNEGKH